MARDWRRAVLAAFAAAMLGCACALGAYAQPADEPEEEAKSAPKGKKQQDPAAAQRAIEAALRQLEAGRAEQAVQAVSAAMAGGNLPPAILAKALYVRGMAHRRQGQPAQAISDLAGALWLRGGLGGDDRAGAIKEKSAAYADAGLADPGASKAPSSKTASKAAGSGQDWLSGFFGGVSGPSQEPPSQPKVSASPVERPAASKAAAPALPAWTSKTVVQETAQAPPAAAAPAKAAKARPPPAAAPAKKGLGRYLVQLAAVRTEAEALALAERAKREHAAMLSSRSQSIDRAVFGNMGAYYRVRFGPFASLKETQTVCARLQGKGIDCLPVTQ